MSFDIFCGGGKSSGLISGVVMGGAGSFSFEGGRIVASLEAASEDSCSVWKINISGETENNWEQAGKVDC